MSYYFLFCDFLIVSDSIDVLCLTFTFAGMTTGVQPPTCFRMYTKSQSIIYMKTTTFRVQDDWTKNTLHVISLNSVLE